MFSLVVDNFGVKREGIQTNLVKVSYDKIEPEEEIITSIITTKLITILITKSRITKVMMVVIPIVIVIMIVIVLYAETESDNKIV